MKCHLASILDLAIEEKLITYAKFLKMNESSRERKIHNRQKVVLQLIAQCKSKEKDEKDFNEVEC